MGAVLNLLVNSDCRSKCGGLKYWITHPEPTVAEKNLFIAGSFDPRVNVDYSHSHQPKKPRISSVGGFLDSGNKVLPAAWNGI